MKNRRITRFFTATLCVMMLAGCGVPKYDKQMKNAEKYMKEGTYDKAVEAYSKAIGFKEESLEAYHGLLTAMISGESNATDISGAIDDGLILIETIVMSEEGFETDEDKALAIDFFDIALGRIEDYSDEKFAFLDRGVRLFGDAYNYDEEFMKQISDIGDAFIQESDYLNAKDYVDKMTATYADNTGLKEYAAKIYAECIAVFCSNIEYYLSGNNVVYAKEYADIAIGLFPDDETVKDIAATTYVRYEEEQGYIEVLKSVQSFVEEGNWQEIANLVESEEYKKLTEKIGDAGSYIYMPQGGTDGMGIGYYSMEGCECGQFYLGELAGGIREGYGKWFMAENSEGALYSYLYEGNFSNDVPNGEGRIISYIGEYEIENWEGTFNNGLLSGTFTYELYNSDLDKTLTATYTITDGVYQPVEVKDWVREDREGEYVFCIAYDTLPDGRATASYASIPVDAAKVGVMHFNN